MKQKNIKTLIVRLCLIILLGLVPEFLHAQSYTSKADFIRFYSDINPELTSEEFEVAKQIGLEISKHVVYYNVPIIDFKEQFEVYSIDSISDLNRMLDSTAMQENPAVLKSLILKLLKI